MADGQLPVCPVVAQMANMLLATSGEEMKITGSSGDDEVVAHLPADVPHYSVLSRTVSGVIDAALSANLQEKRVFWVGALKGTKRKNWKIFTGSLPKSDRTKQIFCMWP